MTIFTDTKKNLGAGTGGLISLALFSSIFVLSGCTRERAATLPEQLKRDVFAISAIDGANIRVETGSQPIKKLSVSEKLRSTTQFEKLSITKVKAPERLKPMFADFNLYSKSSTSYKIVLGVDEKYVTAYKVVSDFSDLTVEQQQLSMKKGPIFFTLLYLSTVF